VKIDNVVKMNKVTQRVAISVVTATIALSDPVSLLRAQKTQVSTKTTSTASTKEDRTEEGLKAVAKDKVPNYIFVKKMIAQHGLLIHDMDFIDGHKLGLFIRVYDDEYTGQSYDRPSKDQIDLIYDSIPKYMYNPKAETIERVKFVISITEDKKVEDGISRAYVQNRTGDAYLSYIGENVFPKSAKSKEVNYTSLSQNLAVQAMTMILGVSENQDALADAPDKTKTWRVTLLNGQFAEIKIIQDPEKGEFSIYDTKSDEMVHVKTQIGIKIFSLEHPKDSLYEKQFYASEQENFLYGPMIVHPW
jgi:hypothetical protein